VYVAAEIYIADLSESSVERLASCTRLLISTVGPYIKYGTPVLEACAVYGTHYVDCTGEYPWVYEMIKRCHQTAKRKGAIVCTFLLAKLRSGGSNDAVDHPTSWVRVGACGLGYLRTGQSCERRTRCRRHGCYFLDARGEVSACCDLDILLAMADNV